MSTEPTLTETPAAETVSPPQGAAVDETKSSPAVETEPAAESAAPRPRVQLNPTITPEQARPRPAPTLGAPVAPAYDPTASAVFVAVVSPTPLVTDAPPASSAEQPSGPAQPGSIDANVSKPFSPPSRKKDREAPLATFVPPREKVALPPKEGDLDSELQAEIDAALSGAGSLAVDEPVAASVPGEPAPDTQPAPSPTELTEEQLQPGMRLKGKVQNIHGEDVIVDLRMRASGILKIRQFEEGKIPEVGHTVKVVVERYDASEGLIHLNLARAVVTKPRGNWHEVAEGQIVDCMVTKSNKGGLEVSISNLRGFLPASQVDYGFVSNLEEYVGQKLRVKITEVNPQKRNLVVSRRSFLEMERAEAREEMWKKIEIGQVYTGTVRSIKDYGAFVDIGGMDGLLHVAEMSWSRIHHPKDVLSEGQSVEVKVLSVDREKSKVSLGMKQLIANPWQNIADNYPVGRIVKGKVTKVADFGAFVELEPGVEGLVHISELDHRRVHRVTDFVDVGKEVEVKVLTVDIEKKRIALSLKAMTAKPERDRKEKVSDEDLAPSGGAAYERKRKSPLKGGGTESGGLLFNMPGQ